MVLATGGDSRITTPQFVWCAPSGALPEDFEQLWRRHGGDPAAIPKVAEGREVVGVLLGAGTGDRVEIVECLSGLVLRVRPQGKAAATGRFAFLSLPVGIQSVEFDEGAPGAPRWRGLPSQGQTAFWCSAPGVTPVAGWLHERGLPSAAPGQAFFDHLSLRRFLRENGATELAGLDVDFTRDVVLLMRSTRFAEMLCARDRIVLRDEQPFRKGGKPWREPEPPRLMRIERPVNVLEIEGRDVDRADADPETAAWSVQQRIELRPPEPAELLPVLRVCELLRPAQGDLCERADTAADWQALRQRLGIRRGREVPGPDWCDFANACVVAVAVGNDRAVRCCELAVASEEGVDVLTIVQKLADAPPTPGQAPLVLLALPRRPHALSIVVRELGDAPRERTLATLPPLR